MTEILSLIPEAEEKLSFAIRDLEDLSINGNHSINIKDVSRVIEESREILIYVLSTNLQSKTKQNEQRI
jgi:hypothetical protein